MSTPYGAKDTGTCPHCGNGVRFELLAHVKTNSSGSNAGGSVRLTTQDGSFLRFSASVCPQCDNPILYLMHHHDAREGTSYEINQLLWPESVERPVPGEVAAEDADVAEDFREAVAVLPKSKKASAALSLRCLQAVLTTKGGATGRSLAGQIESVLDDLPHEIALNVDAIRQVGNFAAHPIKSENTGEIAEVEEGEAEWLLDVLEELFDHYYVRPAQAAQRRADLNEKLQDLGKPALKQPQGAESDGDEDASD